MKPRIQFVLTQWNPGSSALQRRPGQGTPPEVDVVGGEGFPGTIGAPGEEQRRYSAEKIRRARILPDLPWSRIVRDLPGTWRRGHGSWVRVLARAADQARCTNTGPGTEGICAQRDCSCGGLCRTCILIACHPYPSPTMGARGHSLRT